MRRRKAKYHPLVDLSKQSIIAESYGYLNKCLKIYIWNILQWINRHILKTYPLIEDCARCRDCGRNVHDYSVPDDIWISVIGSEDGVYCYDCFCDRADRKNISWRMNLVVRNLLE